jgi:hypothetical protein
VLSVRFLGDDMVHAPPSWVTSPSFHGADDEPPAGASLEHQRAAGNVANSHCSSFR